MKNKSSIKKENVEIKKEESKKELEDVIQSTPTSEYAKVSEIEVNDAAKNDTKKADVTQNSDDKIIDEEVRKGKQLFSIQDLVDALSLVISTGKEVLAKTTLDLIEVCNMQIEKPEEMIKFPEELDFLFDNHGEWCLALARQRRLKESVDKTNTYPGFIKGLHHLIEGTTKEFYRIIRIKNKIIRGVHNIIDPEFIGFTPNVNKIVKADMSNMILRNLDRLVPVSQNEFDTIPVVLNPQLQEFQRATQEFIIHDNLALREWVENFSRRKRLVLAFGAGPLYGRNNVRWLNHSHPMNLSRFISILPKIMLSVAYASQFVFPTFSLTSVDIAQVSQTMEINSNKSEPLAKIVNSPVTSQNLDDFRKIVLALTLPQQVMIDIEYDNNENAILSGTIGLMSKMIFSTTPGFRTITQRSAHETDIIVGRMLTKLGYVYQ